MRAKCVLDKNMKTFNTTGTCDPMVHYMVNIDRQVDAAAKLVRQGHYFCINRGRQYGKTTTIKALKTFLEEEGYAVFSLSFEGKDSSFYSSLGTLCYNCIMLMNDCLDFEEVKNLSSESVELIKHAYTNGESSMTDREFGLLINKVTKKDPKIILIIDEVDQAGDHDEFIKFLGTLRALYLNHCSRPTFLSVILAGVYDIKNLKLKMRSEEQHQYNSPWNIAVTFDTDMSLPADGIAGMLDDYANEHDIQFDTTAIGQLIYDYTSGYPFLVSRICQIIDAENYGWDKDGVLKAVNLLLKEGNTLFDDMLKKITQYQGLSDMLHRIIFSGQRVSYNYYDRDINIAVLFNFVKEQDGAAVISCRIFETWLYSYFISNDKGSDIYQNGEYDKPRFIHDGYLDMRHLLERFCLHFNEIYRPEYDDKFVEANGRQIFLTYLRPIINGTGNYYCEAQTRDLTRTDVIVDYLGQQYVIELKIWRGEAYNERGEQQLAEYLDYYHLDTGYMLSFCFNKNKQPGIHEVKVAGRTIIEAVV